MADYKFNQLITEIDRLNQSLDQAFKNASKMNESLSKSKDTGIAKLREELNQLGITNSQLTKLEKEYNAVQKQSIKLKEQAAKEADKISRSLDKEYQTKQELIKLQKQEISQQAKQNAIIEKYNKVTGKSIDELKQQQKYLSALRNQLDMTSDRYKKISTQLNDVNSKLKRSGEEINDQRANVGNYNGAVSKGIQALKSYAIGFLGISAAIGALRSLWSAAKEYVDMAKNVIEQETKLTQVLRVRTGATSQEIKSVFDLTLATEELGVVDGDVLNAGAQQLSLSVKRIDTVKKLIPAMADLLVQQKGVNATESDAVALSKAFGKALNGSDLALKKMGITLTESESKMLKLGNEEERAALLTKIVGDRVGEMNKQFAKTDVGKLANAQIQLDNLKEDMGKELIPLMVSFKQLTLSAFKTLRSSLMDLQEPIKVITEISENIKTYTESIKFAPELTDSWGKSLWKLLKPLGFIFEYNKLIFRGLKEILILMGIMDTDEERRAKKIRATVDDLTDSFKSLSEVQKNKVMKEFEALEAKLKSAKISQLEFTMALNELIIKAKTGGLNLNNYGDGLDGAGDSAEDAANKLEKVNEQIAIQNQLYKERAAENLKTKQAYILSEEDFRTAKQSGAIENPENKGFDDEMQSQLNALNEYFKFTGEEAKEVAQIALDSLGQIGDAIMDSVEKQIDYYDTLIDKQQDSIDKTQEQLENELDRINELKVAGQAYDNERKEALEKQLKNEQKYLSQSVESQRQAKERQRRLAIVQANIDIASAILSIWAQAGTNYWIKIAQTIAFGLAGAIQLNTIRTAQYATGTEYLERGQHPVGRDTIPIMADEGERIISAKQNKLIPKGFKNELIPLAVNHYLNQGSMMYGDPQALKHLEGIENNTRQNKGYKADGRLAWEIKGNHKYYY